MSGGIADLADLARRDRLQRRVLEVGSLAVSNLGMLGVDEFSASLNPPQFGTQELSAGFPISWGSLAVNTRGALWQWA
ncbi:hypothetical protein E3T28_07200 [Cryobacterium sinapicolor]|uniref:2-oxoacid dehydrogenase acyltransferase catalytic domain-containing protein n=1 Tax=Cryobacterium sinapicolor TaxID=1259236 RepID=A0ABY2J8R3_9MICO|nr:hypothetical protein E3T28_07200 [Cryobacterium sinapicolor]